MTKTKIIQNFFLYLHPEVIIYCNMFRLGTTWMWQYGHDTIPDRDGKLPMRMTEKEKMLAGEVYSAVDPELIEELMATREVLYEYNTLRPSETQRMKEILKSLLGHVADDDFLINQPFRCDYGKQISIGRRFFANFNFTVLDEARVTIGDDCFIGPNVSIYTACHSTDPVERNSRQEWAKPVTIGHNPSEPALLW